ncbi:MAG: histidine kinase [Flavobacterium sp.]
MKQLYILWVVCLCSLTLWGQDPVHRVINNLNGLPCNTVYYLKQDKTGFIWIAHDRGLSRYDGKRFVHYSGKEQQGKALSNLLEYNGTVYCQDFSGNFYRTAPGQNLVKIKALQAKGYAPAGILNGNLLTVPVTDTLRTLNLATGAYTATPVKGYFSSAVFYTPNRLEAITNNGLLQVTPGGQTTTTPIGTASTNHLFFLLNSGGRRFVFTKNTAPHVYELSGSMLHPVTHLPAHTFIQNVQIQGGYIWVSTSAGAYCFNKDMTPAFNGHCFFKEASVSNVITDREGNYWFATLNKGLIMAMTLQARVYPYENRNITALHQTPDGSLYAGTDANQLLRFNAIKGRFDSITAGTSRHEIINIQEPLPGQIYFFSDKTYIHSLDGTTEIFQAAGKSAVAINPSSLAIAYSSGTAITGIQGALPKLPAWLPVAGNMAVPNTYMLFNKPLRCKGVAYIPQTETLYITTVEGLYYFSPKGKGFITDRGVPIMGIQARVVQGNLYVGTSNNGVYKVTGTTVQEHLTVKDGLLGNAVYRIRVQGNRLWMLMDNGIQCYDIQNHKFTAYLTSDCLSRAALRDILPSGNTLYAATSEGLLEFNTQLNTYNSVAPVIHINRVMVNGRPVHYRAGMVLSHRSHTVDIDYATLAYKGEDAVTVQYKVNNGRWSSLAERSGVLNLAYLSDGSYRVALRAINEDGVASVKPVLFTFSIQAPVYKRWWFIMLCAAAASAAAVLYYRNRIKAIRQKNELITQKLKLEHELQQSILSTVRSQMNPHFLFNALNTIQSYIYTNEREQASLYLGKFSELTRLILDLSGKELVPLSEELRALTLYIELEKLRFEDSFTYTISTSPGLSPETIYVPPMLIQPYVENAMKHGLLHKKNNRVLALHISAEQTGIVACVEDNGIGRRRSGELNARRSKNHQSFATYANHKRLEILNRGLPKKIWLHITDKHDENGNACGTVVRLHIPYLYPEK